MKKPPCPKSLPLVLLLAGAFLFVGCARQSQLKPSLLCFGAEWCGQCQKDVPTIQAITDTRRVDVYYYDVDEHPQVAERYGVKDIPMYFLYAPNGRLIWSGHNIGQVVRYGS